MELYNYYRLCTLPPSCLVSSALGSPQTCQEDIRQYIQVLSSNMVRELLYSLEIPITGIFSSFDNFENHQVTEIRDTVRKIADIAKLSII